MRKPNQANPIVGLSAPVTVGLSSRFTLAPSALAPLSHAVACETASLRRTVNRGGESRLENIGAGLQCASGAALDTRTTAAAGYGCAPGGIGLSRHSCRTWVQGRQERQLIASTTAATTSREIVDGQGCDSNSATRDAIRGFYIRDKPSFSSRRRRPLAFLSNLRGIDESAGGLTRSCSSRFPPATPRGGSAGGPSAHWIGRCHFPAPLSGRALEARIGGGRIRGEGNG